MTKNIQYSDTSNPLLFFSEEDGVSALVVTGIIVGCVIGGGAVIGGVSFGVYKYASHGKEHVPSPDSSRRSSASSDDGITNRAYDIRPEPRRLPPITEYRPPNIYS